ncbi:putative acetyltransferase [Arthrobacter monumenti]
MTLPPAANKLQNIPLGSRVVVRYRIAEGLTDALGYLTDVTDTDCSVQTRTGDVVIGLEQVQAAKQVPPPPPRRSGRRG